MAATNREGLTFEEWINAARKGDLSAEEKKKFLPAWKKGEDPTEHAANPA